jgi:hypothetical protein
VIPYCLIDTQFDMSMRYIKLTLFLKIRKTLILMYYIDVSNDFRIMLYFMDMIYIVISFNQTVEFVKQLFNKELLEVLYY